MSRKSLFKLFAFLMIFVLVVSACTPAAEEPVPTQPPAEEPAPVETEAGEPAEPSSPTEAEQPAPEAGGDVSGNLLIWVQQANQDVFEQTLLDDFKAQYPDLTIEFVNYPPAEVANQMALAIQGGAGGPDLGITENASIGRLVELGGLLDVTQQMQEFAPQMNEPALNESTREGKNYCVPWDIGPVVTFYRRDIFEAAGLSSDPDDVSEMISTWDKFQETCQTIKDETGLPCFANNQANNYGDMFFNMTWQQDLDLFSDDGQILVDQPEFVATLEKMGQFWDAELTTDDSEWTDNWYATLNADIDNETVKPIATVTIGSWMGNFLKTWVAPDQAGNWGVAYMPAFEEGGTRAANQGGSCAFIPANSSNPEAAWAFIEFFFLNKDNHVKLFEYSDYFPAYEATYDDPLFDRPDDYFGGQVTRQVYAEAARNIPVANQYGPYAGAIRGAVTTAIQQYATGQLSAEEALQQAAENARTETGLQ